MSVALVGLDYGGHLLRHLQKSPGNLLAGDFCYADLTIVRGGRDAPLRL